MRYSKAPNYFEIAKSAIEEMYNQVGLPKFDKNGIMKKGIIVRHLLLPGKIEDSKKIIAYLKKTYNDKIFISIMNQYTPIKSVKNIPELNQIVKNDEYNKLINFACNLNIKNAFIQENNTQEKNMIPKFDLTGIN